MVEEARELDLFVADGGDFGYGPLEVALHEVADGIKLHANFFNLMRGGEALVGKGSQNSSGDGSFQKSSSVHAGIVQRIAKRGTKQKRPKEIGAPLLGGSHSALAGIRAVTPRLRLEQELQTKLQRTRAMCGARMPEIASVYVIVDAGAADTASGPLRVVEDVEGFGAELEACPFVDLKQFEQRHVKIGPARHIQEITPGISKGKPTRIGEGAGIEEQGARSPVGRSAGRRWSSVGVAHDVRKNAGARSI